jgi:hypothetical protein
MKKQMLIGSLILSAVALAFAAQDKYSVSVPNGLAFSEFKGYEGWQTVAISHTDSQNVMRAILGNPELIKAYQDGIPAHGEPFPEGSKIAKIEWRPKTIVDAPFSAAKPDTVSGTLAEVEFMVKDTKRFPDTHGWGYAAFTYDPAGNTFKPLGSGAGCGGSCHNFAAKKDFVFTEYSPR